MSARKTPVLLRPGPMSGRIYALLRYRHVKSAARNGAPILQVIGENGRWDVTADFDALVCELLLNDAPRAIELLDGAAKGSELEPDERKELKRLRRSLIKIVERHNAGPHVRLYDPTEDVTV